MSNQANENDAVEPAVTETYDELGGQPAPEGNELSPQQAESYGLDDDAGQGSGSVKDPQEWATGDDPMTPAQRDYLEALAEPVGEPVPPTLTKAEASEAIDRLKGESA